MTTNLSTGRQADLDGTGMRIAIATARFNDVIGEILLTAARRALAEVGVAETDIEQVWVPGAFELPLVAQALARSGEYDAVICFGVVIRGQTSHYEYVAGQCAEGIQRVQLDTGVPVLFGVLTTEDVAQAMERADPARQDKGAEVALGAVEMVQVLRRIEKNSKDR